jgi:hypothetical protein
MLLRDRALVLCAAILLAAFVLVAASHAASDGLCCGDDAAIALAAKSLARGDGYALPLDFTGASGHFPMDAGISTGPTVVLPAALSIAMFGTRTWAPSAASTALSLGLLLCVLALVRRREGTPAAALFVLAALPALYAFTSGEFFVHWYALLGEATAWSLLALCAWVVAGRQDGDTARRAFVAGVLAGLAINAKLLAMLGALAIGGYYAWWLLRRRPWALRQGLAYSAGLALPPVLFEAARMATLGFSGYRAWLVQLRAFMSNQLSPQAAAAGPARRALDFLAGLDAAMGMTWLALLVPPRIVLAMRWRRADASRAATAALLAWLAAMTNLAWWLSHSNGWPRYALVGLALLAYSLAFTVIALPRRAGVALLVVALACLVPWQRLDRLQAAPAYALHNGFVENPRVNALRAVSIYLDRAPLRDSVLVGYWWASLAALEYLADTPRRTVAFNRIDSADPARPGTLLLVNPKWDAMAGADANPAYAGFTRRCRDTVLQIAPLRVARCRFDARANSPGATR